MKSNKVWDEEGVHSLKDLLRDKSITEAILGRAFAILAIKGEELSDELKTWKARIVFQGSNVRTQTGTSAADLFKRASNAPASFAAARRTFLSTLSAHRRPYREEEPSPCP